MLAAATCISIVDGMIETLCVTNKWIRNYWPVRRTVDERLNIRRFDEMSGSYEVDYYIYRVVKAYWIIKRRWCG